MSVYKFSVVGLLSCETKILFGFVVCRHRQQMNVFASRSHWARSHRLIDRLLLLLRQPPETGCRCWVKCCSLTALWYLKLWPEMIFLTNRPIYIYLRDSNYYNHSNVKYLTRYFDIEPLRSEASESVQYSIELYRKHSQCIAYTVSQRNKGNITPCFAPYHWYLSELKPCLVRSYARINLLKN